MKWKFSLPESSVLVYYIVKLTGLAPFTLKNNRFQSPTLLGKLYPVFIAASYLLFIGVTFAYTMGTVYTQNYTLFVKVWSTIVYIMSIPSVCFSLILFSFMHKKIVYLMNKLCTVSDELKSLGIEEDHEKFFKILFVNTAMGNAGVIAALIVLVYIDSDWHVFMSIKYSIESWISFNTILSFAQILMCIKQRFNLVNGKLYDLFIPLNHPRSSHHARICVMNEKAREDNVAEGERFTDCECIRKIGSLHLNLCDLVDQTTHVFATPILLNSLQFSSQLIICSYWEYATLRYPNQFMTARMLCSTIRMVIVIVYLFIIAHASATICQKGNATRAVLFKVWTKFKPPELTNEFFQFSNQLLHTRVAVSAFGFMDLDYSFIFKIFCTVVTYLIIMVQLEGTEVDMI